MSVPGAAGKFASTAGSLKARLLVRFVNFRRKAIAVFNKIQLIL